MVALPPVAVIPIIGARKLSQLQDNLASSDLSLSPEQVRALDEASQIDLAFPYTSMETGSPRRLCTVAWETRFWLKWILTFARLILSYDNRFRLSAMLSRRLEELGLSPVVVLRHAGLPIGLFDQERILLTTEEMFAVTAPSQR
jgi:hypothetical protein